MVRYFSTHVGSAAGSQPASSGVTHTIPLNDGVPTRALSSTAQEADKAPDESSSWGESSTVSVPSNLYYTPP